jgi:hypothetical protein
MALSFPEYVFGADGFTAPESSNPSQVEEMEERSFIL